MSVTPGPAPGWPWRPYTRWRRAYIRCFRWRSHCGRRNRPADLGMAEPVLGRCRLRGRDDPLARRAREEGLRASRGDERFGAGRSGRAAEGAGGDWADGGVPVAEGPDETVQSASVRRLAAAGVQICPGCSAAAWGVGLDSTGEGGGGGGPFREGRRRRPPV